MSPYGTPPGAPQAPQTLEIFLSQRAPLTAPELMPLLGPVMDQLGTLHGAGQYHGNISPETITVTPTPGGDGTMAAWLPPSTPLAAGAWPWYLAPEQLYQGGQPGYWSDIYAMACVVHRALTGQPPFAGSSVEEVRQGHLQTPPPLVTTLRPDLAPELNGALQLGLAKAPADRHASMQAFRQATEAAAMAAPPPAAAYGAAAPPAAAVAYAPAGMPPGPAPVAVSPPPPTMLQPTQMPKAKSGMPMVAIMAGATALMAVVGVAVALFAAKSTSSQKESAPASVADKPEPVPAKRATSATRKDVKKPVAKAPKPLALPGVDDKIKPEPPPGAADASSATHYKVDISARPTRGAHDAVVVLALWSDFQCPWCKRVNPLLGKLLKKYPKDLKIAWMDFPLRFHKQAMIAAIAGQSVFRQRGSSAFWQFHDKVFANSRSISKDSLMKWAKEVGADDNAVRRDLGRSDRRRAIQDQMANAKQIGVRGTPTMMVNGQRFKGRRSVEGFATVIESEIAKAQKAIKAGETTRKGYYAHLMRTGRTQKAAKDSPGGKTAKRPSRKRRQLDPKAIYRIPVHKDDPWKGAKRPLVTMVIWSDFECPYCRYMACTLEAVVKKYRKTVRMVFRHNPLSFHKYAMPAAEAVEAARAIKGRKGFWRMYAKVFPLSLCPRKSTKANLRTWLDKAKRRSPKLTRSTLERFAKKLRLRKSRFKRYMDRHTHRARIKRQAATANALGARGTPALFVNGRYVRGFRDYAAMKVILDEELRKARRLLKSGVSRRKLYDHITARGARSLVYLP